MISRRSLFWLAVGAAAAPFVPVVPEARIITFGFKGTFVDSVTGLPLASVVRYVPCRQEEEADAFWAALIFGMGEAA